MVLFPLWKSLIMPHIGYAEYKDDLTYEILLYLNDFVDEFPKYVIDYMAQKPAFVDKLILQCTDSLRSIDDLVILALKAGHTETAKRIMECAFANQHTDIQAKVQLIKNCIDECSDWEELETMELFRDCVFPIVFDETDVRIKNKISRWQEQMRSYIESVERDCDQYAYSRIYAWRAKYRDAEIDPTRYRKEEEYLAAVNEQKYGWRRFCNKRFGVSPDDYETRKAYEDAVKDAIERETQLRRELGYIEDTEADTTVYSFCKVSISFPGKPYYDYLTGDHKLEIGDRVIVPFGIDNARKEAVVVSLGKCYGCAFPCRVSKLKTVIGKLDEKKSDG